MACVCRLPGRGNHDTTEALADTLSKKTAQLSALLSRRLAVAVKPSAKSDSIQEHVLAGCRLA
jgi:hypothetical protein